MPLPSAWSVRGVRAAATAAATAARLVHSTAVPAVCTAVPTTASRSTPPKFARNHALDVGGFCCAAHRADFLKRQSSAAFSSTAAPAAAASPLVQGDPVFSVETTPLRFGRGALDELGAACASLGLKRVLLVSDRNVHGLEIHARAVAALRRSGVEIVEYNEVSIEPTLTSMLDAASFASTARVDGFVSLGGGSVIDTAKAANLFSSAPPPDNDPLAYVNAPIGRGLFPSAPLLPHIACPTTAGTGSECTGIAIFDHVALGVKTGIAHRNLRPTMALVDPSTQDTVPKTVCAASGFDVLSHALESYTARSHLQRPAARTPEERFRQRPMSQGANVWADEGCLSALRLLSGALVPACAGEREARDSMMLAATMAGIAFGNVGVHLPHAMSYAVSGGVESYVAPDYSLSEGAIVPHGMAVILSAPAAFRHTSARASSSHRYLEAGRALGVPSVLSGELRDGCTPIEAGEALSTHLVGLMRATGMPNGLEAVGYSTEKHLPQLIEGTLQQQRLLANLPNGIDAGQLEQVFRGAMRYW